MVVLCCTFISSYHGQSVTVDDPKSSQLSELSDDGFAKGFLPGTDWGNIIIGYPLVNIQKNYGKITMLFLYVYQRVCVFQKLLSHLQQCQIIMGYPPKKS